MNWNTILGVAASISLLIPVVLIVYHKLYKHRSLAALMISYSLTALFNLMDKKMIPSSPGFISAFGTIVNFLDIPLMLISLLFFCPVKQKQKTVYILTSVFIVYEIVIASIFGLSREAVVLILGPGLFVVLGYTFYLFSKQIKMTIEFGKNAGRTIMLTAILFSYGCYSLVYYFYYIQNTPHVDDAYILYFIATLVSSILMSFGLNLTRKRIKELMELKTTRRELAIFFKN